MHVFDYDSYKICVNDWIAAQPKSGHGQLRKLASHLNVNSVVMSQIFRGDRDLTVEQAVGVAGYMGLVDQDRDYFLLLVQRARAGTNDLKKILANQIQEHRHRSQALKNRIRHSSFTERERATFYSHWYYSAIRLGVSIESSNTVVAIAEKLNLERVLVSKVVQFLLAHQLIVEKEGRFDIGPQVTHVAHDSPFVNRHHSNWRMKGIQAMDRRNDEQLFYTGPMALSSATAELIRKDLIGLVEKATKLAANSKSEVLACLNIDWFRL